jgi:hypothetical protein
MGELTIENERLRVTVQAAADGDVLLAAATAAFTSAEKNLPRARRQSPSSPPTGGEEGNRLSPPEGGRKTRPPARRKGSQADRIRVIAIRVLADGHLHERREIAAAVGAEGLRTQHVDTALSRDDRFVREENVMGRPVYRDSRAVRPPVREQSEADRPDWMRSNGHAPEGDVTRLGGWEPADG